MTGINPRRPLDENQPNGYMESDRDFVLNNLDSAVALLEYHELEKVVIMDQEVGNDAERTK